MNFSTNRKLLFKIIAGFLFIAITFVVFTVRQSGQDEIRIEPAHNEPVNEEAQTPGASSEVSETADDPEEVIIVIDVSGEVMNPSIYKLSEGARVYEAVLAAGGLTEDADTRNTNLAAPLSDGMKLYIPNKEDVKKEAKQSGEAPGSRYINGNASLNAASSADTNDNRRININTANSDELQKLTGVGPVTAQKIITYRNEYGNFRKIEDLMNVSGIGEKTFEKLKNKIATE